LLRTGVATESASRRKCLLEKIFHFDSEREQYRSGAAIVQCFDQRFQLVFAKYLKRAGIANVDEIKLGGGAKALASPDSERDREFVLDQVRKSIRLHDTRLVILTLHSDCGAYGGLAGAFQGDPVYEAERQERELRRAATCLKEAIPEVEVRAYFANFEGIYAVELDG
jgi:hypothetical protein